MGPMIRASRRSPLVLALILVAACSAQPLTHEQKLALELETYCRGIAEDERSKHLAQREQRARSIRSARTTSCGRTRRKEATFRANIRPSIPSA